MKPSYEDRLIALFTSQPRTFFDGIGLSHVAGVYAWRSRVSDARHTLQREGLGTIINEQRRQPDGSTRSLYAYIPAKER